MARELTVYSKGGEITARDGDRVDTPSLLMPEDWGDVEGMDERATALTMFANLPDISYSFADWAMGNERCPLDYSAYDVDADTCFYFRGWMGALNSTHFPPQSHASYAWYHDIALGLAAHCVSVDASLDGIDWGDDEETTELVQAVKEECAYEALAFEGVGHHYLQDMWSSGHTWERWGSPKIEDWVSPAAALSADAMLTALAVGSVAGTIHGHESLSGVHDPMCSPHDAVQYLPGPETPVLSDNMVGDYHLAAMTERQAEGLRQCAQGGLDAVLSALSDADSLGMSAQGTGVTPTEATCFAHRAHDQAWATGMLAIGDTLDAQAGAQTIRVLGRLVLSEVADLYGEELPQGGLVQGTRREVVRMGAFAEAAAWRSDKWTTTELAEQVLRTDDGGEEPLTFLGTERNSGYVSTIESGLLQLDPTAGVILGDQTGSDKHEQDADAIRRTFHQAHADYWCRNADTNPDDAESELRRARTTCQAGDTAEAREAGCGVCVELGTRIARIGEDADSWDASRPPLCAAFDDDGPWLYVSPGVEEPRSEAVAAWCRGGKAWAATDDALWRFDASRAAGELGTDAERFADLPGEVRAMAGDANAVYASIGGSLYVVDSGGATAFGGGDCGGAAGLDLDTFDEVLYVACESDDTVVSFDVSGSTPSVIDTMDLIQHNADRPVDVAVSPLGLEVAVASYEYRAQKDGLTVFDVTNGVFGTATRVGARIDSFRFSGGVIVELEGAFHAATYGVDWLDDTWLLSSNFSDLECTTASTGSCYDLNSYFATVSSSGATAEAWTNVWTDGRGRGVERLWDDLGAVAGHTGTTLSIVHKTDDVTSTMDIELGQYGASHVAADRGSKRIFVSYDSGTSTCGVTVIDGTDSDPISWSAEALDDTLGCVRAVVVPQ